jgi:hypothetical protein
MFFQVRTEFLNIILDKQQNRSGLPLGFAYLNAELLARSQYAS